MSPSHVAEPTYEAIRQRLMVGAWPMGSRLEAGRLAEDLGVSITPVRDALNRLVGEKLVDLVPGMGFHVPRLTERNVRELLDVNLMLLLGAIEVSAFPDSPVTIDPTADDHVARTEALFGRIASLSGNAELLDAINSLGVRLHAVRSYEIGALTNAEADLQMIVTASRSGRRHISRALRRYHEVRKDAVAHLIERLHGGSAV